MSLDIDVYFDEQLGSAFDEITSIYNLRNARAAQRLASAQSVAELDARFQKILSYLVSKQSTTRGITLECLDEALGLELVYAGDVFASALAAFTSDDTRWIGKIVNGYLALENGSKGLVDALTWLPWKISSPWLTRFLSSKDLKHKLLAVTVCTQLGRLPGQALKTLITREDCQQNEALFERLIFAVGQVKEASLHPILRAATDHEAVSVQTSAHWARLLLNDRNFFSHIVDFSLTSNEAFACLSPWVILSRPISESKTYVSSALKKEGLASDLIILAIAMHGDPSVLKWLVQTYNQPELSRWVALAAHQITGIDIKHDSLINDAQQAPDEMDVKRDGIYLDQDTSLPYPDTAKLFTLIDRVYNNFEVNTRHFLGCPIKNSDQLVTLLKTNPSGMARIYRRILSGLSGKLYVPHTYIPTQLNTPAAS